jgi:hypothetical protein
MPIDITTEKLISAAEYARMRPTGRNGRPMHLATAYRHFSPGVNGIALEHVKFGGQTYTSVEAVQRFAERLTSARDALRSGAPISPAPPTAFAGRSAFRRGREDKRTEQRLDAAGISTAAGRRKGDKTGVR